MNKSELDRPDDALDWTKTGGLIPAIVQDAGTGRILMLGYMNPESLKQTRSSGRVTFWSRSRGRLWTKGETSGHYLRLKDIHADCDGDALLIQAEPEGPACHRGTRSCFADDDSFAALEMLGHLERVIRTRRQHSPPGSYTGSLFSQGIHEIAKKLGEEAVEVIISLNQERRQTIEESADLLYHLLVFLAAREVSLEEVLETLRRRHAGRGGEGV